MSVVLCVYVAEAVCDVWPSLIAMPNKCKKQAANMYEGQHNRNAVGI